MTPTAKVRELVEWMRDAGAAWPEDSSQRSIYRRCADDLSALLPSIERLEADNAKYMEALRKLSNEVIGSMPLMEPLVRREIGNTNYTILMQRTEEARALLHEAAQRIEGEQG